MTKSRRLYLKELERQKKTGEAKGNAISLLSMMKHQQQKKGGK